MNIYRYDKSAKTFAKVNETTSDKEEHDEEKILDLATLKTSRWGRQLIASWNSQQESFGEWSVDKITVVV